MKKIYVYVALVLVCSLGAAGCGEEDSSGGSDRTDGGVTSEDAGDDGGVTLGDADDADDIGDAGDAGTKGDSNDPPPLVTAQSSAYATSQYYNTGLQHDLYTGIIILSDQEGTCADAAQFCDGAPEGKALILELNAGREYSTGSYAVNEISEPGQPEEEFTEDSKSASAHIKGSSGDSYITGTIMVTRYDAQGIEGAYVLRDADNTYSDRFNVDTCESFDAPRYGCQW